MQVTSEAYKESMQSVLRNRAYIKVVFGFDKSEVQDAASISGDMDDRCNTSDIFKQGTDNFVYASLEENFIALDQGLMWPPINNLEWNEKSFISKYLVSDIPAVITISFSDGVKLNKIIFNFGDNYPVDFDIAYGSDVFEVRNNDQRIVEVDNDFGVITELIITVTSMKNPETRLRLYSVDFESLMVFENDKIIDSDLKGSMSPINETLPQRSFSVNLVNEDHQFDLDNPKSNLSMLETSTVMTVYYGYQLDDNSIEWIKYGGLYCYTWDANESQATISGRDILQTIEKTYRDGSLSAISLYNLAVAVLVCMGINNYHIDEDLKDITTSNPLPLVDCRECLQIIANAAGKKLLLQNDGGISIGEGYDLILTSNGDEYGKLQTILEDTEKQTYASLEDDYTKIDDLSMLFPPTSSSLYLDVGYVSTKVSQNSGYFVGSQANLNETDDVLNGNLAVLTHVLSNENNNDGEDPYLDLDFTELVYFGGLKLVFGATICEIFEVDLMQDGSVYKTYTISDNQEKTIILYFDFYQMDEIRIRFIKTQKPRNRVRVDYIEVFKTMNYTITGNDIIGFPKFEKFPRIKELTVPYYNYQAELEESKLSEIELSDVSSTLMVYTINVSEPCTEYRLSVSAGTVTIVDSNAYWVKFRFASIGDSNPTVILYGKKHTRIERTVVKQLNADGENVQWKNPLVNSEEMANHLADYLIEYYTCQGLYTFETRGDPEVEVNDRVKQEHYSGKDINVLVTNINLEFDGGFSGNMTTLRLGEG